MPGPVRLAVGCALLAVRPRAPWQLQGRNRSGKIPLIPESADGQRFSTPELRHWLPHPFGLRELIDGSRTVLHGFGPTLDDHAARRCAEMPFRDGP
jgi:hypothetical protein